MSNNMWLFADKFHAVLVSGKAGVGKSTFSEFLKNELNHYNGYHIQSNIVPFATGIKVCAKKFFGWNGNKDEKGRKLLQVLGQAGRDYDINVWVKYAEGLAIDLMLNVAIMDDWRFPNEEEYSKEFRNVTTVRISSPEREILKGTPYYYDVSETSLSEDRSKYDYYIDNTGSLESLKGMATFVAENMIVNEVNRTELFLELVSKEIEK